MQRANIYGKNKTFFRILFLVFAVAIMCIIFYFSSQNATRSIKTSSDLILRLSNFFIFEFNDKTVAQQKIIIDSLQFIVRKSAHFLIYCGLGFNFCGLYSTFKFRKFVCFSLAVISSSLYAVTDELHQYYVVGRSAEMRDVLIDTVGAVLGAVIFLAIFSVIIAFLTKRKKGCVRLRKKVLINNNQLLETKLLEADSVIKELREEVEILNDKIKILQAENIKLNEALLKRETEVVEEFIVADDEVNQEPIKNYPMGFKINADILDIKEINTDDLNDYAVSVVAKIILECTKADMTVMASNSTSKDNDRNVILGSAESAKARIFEYLSKNDDYQYIKSKIEAELNNYLTCIQNILNNYN